MRQTRYTRVQFKVDPPSEPAPPAQPDEQQPDEQQPDEPPRAAQDNQGEATEAPDQGEPAEGQQAPPQPEGAGAAEAWLGELHKLNLF